MVPIESVCAAIRTLSPSPHDALCELIRCPSLPGREAEAVDRTANLFAAISEVERVPLSNALRDDPDYSSPIPNIEYEGRNVLRARIPGTGGGRSLIFNTHIDVVPPSPGQHGAFEPAAAAGTIRGRGACDAKGQVAALYAAWAALANLGICLKGDVSAHLVVEEEVGGNGTLALVRRGAAADGCVVMEPTELRVLPWVRGAVWFRVCCEGRAGHSGRAGNSVSALKMATRVMEILEQYHAHLLASSRGLRLFDQFANPMPITFGKLHSGDWPASAPARAVVEGVLGFLQNRTRDQVATEIRQAIMDAGDPWLRDHFTLELMYRHDAHILDPAHPLVSCLRDSCRRLCLAGEVSAMTASCDSWYYNNQLGIPTVVFGPGSLAHAHSAEEQIRIEDVETAAAVLVDFMSEWCGMAAA